MGTEVSRNSGRFAGFTLIELMVVVAILGVLAAVAVPAFLAYQRRSKTAEVTQQLNSMFKAASTLYASELSGRSVTATAVRSCVVEPTDRTPALPGKVAQRFVAHGGFKQLNFTIADYVYYGYGISSVGSPGQVTCLGHAAPPHIYTFFAEGDLDGNSKFSRFELSVGADEHNYLYHGHGFYIRDEVE